ncbi:MAG: single-stranded-DNA-specific exonuclease RecJ [Oscillatoriales cyanobacterium]|nr:MAG: single-stranded-DNA-specific exonuclease RecJ [Oscillatoriales cyanobacterium]
MAQILWQRGWHDLEQLPGQLDAHHYSPTPSSAFGLEMEQAIARLRQARDQGESVAIWGDFDADGITATAVLWDGLGQFFPRPDRLCYTIPDRLTDSHGLNAHGLERLAAAGVSLVVTCDTGSTNLPEIATATALGLDIIITDHHTLPDTRPEVVAIVNPRYLDRDHPLYHLSGVAVAYKLVEALYAALPEIPTEPLDRLLDLVAIGLIADLVELRGDCRYLAQVGIAQLQRQSDPQAATRPGVAKLLELCKRSGDRPTDISFGLGPRINAVSRIYGDASFCVELLTSPDPQRCRDLAIQAENANTRRKALQRRVLDRVKDRLATIDLSTTRAIILEDPSWAGGVLGLTAGQIAQEYGRPTILLSRDRDDPDLDPAMVFARGSARSAGGIDLYQLVKSQAHLLGRFGGHPFAAGLSLPLANLPLFQAAIERQLALQLGDRVRLPEIIEADLTVTVPELGQDLFRELKAIEPCGMGNPAPRLLIRRCWFENVSNKNIQDLTNKTVRYIKTHFEIWDEYSDATHLSGFPGVWWGHYQEEIPKGKCDAIVELDFNPHHQAYEVRLLAVRPWQDAIDALPKPTPSSRASLATIQLLDWRHTASPNTSDRQIPQLTRCPASWNELHARLHHLHRQQPHATHLALAYDAPHPPDPDRLWRELVGLAKYCRRTGEILQHTRLCYRLDLSSFALDRGLHALTLHGFQIIRSNHALQFLTADPTIATDRNTGDPSQAIAEFYDAIVEQQFHRQYFSSVSLAEIQASLQRVA